MQWFLPKMNGLISESNDGKFQNPGGCFGLRKYKLYSTANPGIIDTSPILKWTKSNERYVQGKNNCAGKLLVRNTKNICFLNDILKNWF